MGKISELKQLRKYLFICVFWTDRKKVSLGFLKNQKWKIINRWIKKVMGWWWWKSLWCVWTYKFCLDSESTSEWHNNQQRWSPVSLECSSCRSKHGVNSHRQRKYLIGGWLCCSVGALLWMGSDGWVGLLMIQGAPSWTGLTGITDIYCFRTPSEKSGGGPEFLRAPPLRPRRKGSLSFWRHLPDKWRWMDSVGSDRLPGYRTYDIIQKTDNNLGILNWVTLI